MRSGSAGGPWRSLFRRPPHSGVSVSKEKAVTDTTRTNMHPADEFEAFRDQAERRGFLPEEIGARFGMSAMW